jgi:hypothetical protein
MNSENDIEISIVSCVNDITILRENLLKSVKKQKAIKYELICIDNTNNKFNSLTSALNYGGKKAKGKYIMFVHQDVYLCNDKWLYRSKRIMDKLPKIGAAGIAGVNNKNEKIGFIIDRGRYWGKPLKKPEVVQTLDEQLIIVPNRIFKINKFDLSFKYHSYVADYCLKVKKLDFYVYVLPLSVEHNSLTIATLNASKINSEDRILFEKHKNYRKIIYKTTGNVGSNLEIIKRKIKDLYLRFLYLANLLIIKKWGFSVNSKIILDIGCIPFEQHKIKKYLINKQTSLGVSNKIRYIIISKKLGIHEHYFIADPEKLPLKRCIKGTSFLFGLLEYVSKDKGEKIVKEVEKISKELIIKVPFNCSPLDRTHILFESNWKDVDFKDRDYNTFIFGLKKICSFPSILFAYNNRRC